MVFLFSNFPTVQERITFLHRVTMDSTTDSSEENSCAMESSAFNTTEMDTSDNSCNRAQFWGAMSIFVEKPHLLNKRLCGVVDLQWAQAYCSVTSLEQTIASTWHLLQTESVPKRYQDSHNIKDSGCIKSSDSLYEEIMLQKLETTFVNGGFSNVSSDDGESV